MKARLTLLFALLLVCLGTGAVLASPPDGLTPSEETVCDTETGAAYGLCNAYCEAMDCDSDNPSASATACNKVRTKFQNVTGRNLPCEVTCPCNDPAVDPLFASVVAGEVPLNACFINSDLPSINVTSEFIAVAQAGFNGFDAYFCVGDQFLGSLTPEQGQLCFDLLEQEATSQGVTCQR